MMRRKLAAIVLSGLLSLLTLSACGGENTSTGNKKLQVLYNEPTAYSLQIGESVEIPLQAEVGDKNYFSINLQTDVHLVGYIHYENSKNSAQTNEEKIFIEAGAKEFAAFLDAFRVGAQGAYDKTITKLTLQNVGQKAGNVEVKSVGISSRSYDRNAELYIEDGKLKVGTSLSMGGALRHLEKLNADVVEYLDGEGNVCIKSNVDKTQVDMVTDAVNFINIHDLGREIQQSYYSLVGEKNGYAPTEEVLYDGTLYYNPVQAGSTGDKQSQIIDFSISEGIIYVKTKPLEWFFDNTLSDSYMENTYILDGSGTLRVRNRFVNFSQFIDMDKTGARLQELPAVYLVHPLNYFYSETVEGDIFDPYLAPLMTSTQKLGLSHSVSGRYHYSLKNGKLKNEWSAFVNEDKFGVGIYMPGAQKYNASRGFTTSRYDFFDNHHHEEDIHNLPAMKYTPSAYVCNYNYFSPTSQLLMRDFVPLEYEYAIFIGSVDEMRSVFQTYRDSQIIDNYSLNAWEWS